MFSDLTRPSTSNWNVPNALSAIRLCLAIAVGSLIEFGWFIAALVCFVVAASTDFIDGWWARRFNQVTKLGRILDPFVDKTIIAAAMIPLAALPKSGLAPWVVTLVICRELLVTSLRGLVEGSGGDFSAQQLGKWKMVAQCASVILCLLTMITMNDYVVLLWARWLIIVAMILLTVLSGAEYVVKAAKSI